MERANSAHLSIKRMKLIINVDTINMISGNDNSGIVPYNSKSIDTSCDNSKACIHNS